MSTIRPNAQSPVAAVDPSRAQQPVRDMNRAEILGTYPADDGPFDAADFMATIVAETGADRDVVDAVLESEMNYLTAHGHVTGDPEQQLGYDPQADAERICDEFHALPDELRDETFRSLAPEYGLTWVPDRVRWSALIKVVVIVAMVGLVLARDGGLYSDYGRGALTMAGVIGAAYYLSNFAQSVWWTLRERHAATRREVA